MVVLGAALLEGIVRDVGAIASVGRVAGVGGQAGLTRVVGVVRVIVQVIANEGSLENLTAVERALIYRGVVDLRAFATDARRHKLFGVLGGAALVAQVGHLARTVIQRLLMLVVVLIHRVLLMPTI